MLPARDVSNRHEERIREMKRWTDSAIAGLRIPSGKSEHIEWHPDVPGFGVRLRGDSRTYVVQYRIGQKQRRDSLGPTTRLRLADALKIARQSFAKIELGEDPGAAKKALAKEAAAAELTFLVVANRYLASKEGELRPRTYQAALLHLRHHWKPLHNLPLDSIKRANVAAALQDIIAKNGRTAAARARSNASALFAWSMGEGLCDFNPVNGTNNPDPVTQRDRILEDSELRAIWHAAGDDTFGKIVKLLILSGCRRNEIGDLRHGEYNSETGMMTIPGERTKNRRTLTLTLPAMALDILRSVPRRDGEEYVFGSRRRRSAGGFNDWSRATIALNERIAAANGQPLRRWTLHDLRRSMRSGLGQIGIRPDVAELCIGHTRTGVLATYDRYSYGPEIKTALARWADHVAAIVGNRETNVVPWRA
jgi:integrase